jgi:dTDP-4-dehydrorhamnose reductase
MKILITGANGLLGQHLVKLLLTKNYHVFATAKGQARISFNNERYHYHEMDIADANAVGRTMQAVQPDVVVHAAAMTQVDDCELNPQHCERTNVQARPICWSRQNSTAVILFISPPILFLMASREIIRKKTI